mmetsp:Transcript_9559/g.21903  ORF Transcript_9559/g.21903 Transcript_9559/m.21903 type:complete len:201 (-) Transcript_9559:363-965(-)
MDVVLVCGTCLEVPKVVKWSRCRLRSLCKPVGVHLVTKRERHEGSHRACGQLGYRDAALEAVTYHLLRHPLEQIRGVKIDVQRRPCLHLSFNRRVCLLAVYFARVHLLQDVQGMIVELHWWFGIKELLVERGIQDPDIIFCPNIFLKVATNDCIIVANHKISSVDFSSMLVIQQHSAVANNSTAARSSHEDGVSVQLRHD